MVQSTSPRNDIVLFIIESEECMMMNFAVFMHPNALLARPRSDPIITIWRSAYHDCGTLI